VEEEKRTEENKGWFQTNIANVVSVCSMIAMVLGGWMFFDERCAHAGTVMRMMDEQTTQIRSVHRDNTIRFKRMELNLLDDKIFYLEAKMPRSQVEDALLNRYRQQRSEVERELREEMRNAR
jgi:hypothetical protein